MNKTQKPKFITAEEAVRAIPNREKIHCFAGFIGADWARDDVVNEVRKARKMAWVNDIFGHNLAIEAGKGSEWHNRSVLRFDIQELKNNE